MTLSMGDVTVSLSLGWLNIIEAIKIVVPVKYMWYTITSKVKPYSSNVTLSYHTLFIPWNFKHTVCRGN